MRKRKAKLNYCRIVLRLPDLDHSKMAVLNSLTSPGSRRVYQFAINQFITWYCSEPRLAFNRIVVVRYRMYLESRRLAANTINQQLAAVRRLAHEAADAGLLSPDLAAGISRVKGVKQLGQRSGNWLSLEQSSEVLSRARGHLMREKRDYAMLALLFGCGLRRSELVGLEMIDVQKREPVAFFLRPSQVRQRATVRSRPRAANVQSIHLRQISLRRSVRLDLACHRQDEDREDTA